MPENIQAVALVAIPTGQAWLDEYAQLLQNKSFATRDAYLRTLRQFTNWLGERPGNEGKFQPHQLSRVALESYFNHLESAGYSASHRARVKAAISGFADFLIEEKEVLRRNPAHRLTFSAVAPLSPRELSPDQRFVLRSLVEREGQPRSAAIFALGYYAGCRVSDIAWLLTENVHLTAKAGWLQVGHKNGKSREVDLLNEARSALFEYSHKHNQQVAASPYFFTSQRAERLSEAGIHHWFRTLKAQARQGEEWEQIKDVTFHDLRHDFAHRARAAGWSIEEVAYYLGHITKRGLPAIATTARYTQVSRESLKPKLKLLKG